MDISQRRNLICVTLGALPPLVVLFSIFFWRPHFGLMDDHFHVLSLLPSIHEKGFWAATVDYARRDWILGVVRLTYIPMAVALYGPGESSAGLPTFVLNWIFVVAITSYSALMLGRLLKLPFWPLFTAPFALFYFHDFFLFPSLQEKMLLPLGITLIYLVSPACKLCDSHRLFSIFGVVVMGVISKTSFVIFFLPCTFLLLDEVRRHRKKVFQNSGIFFLFVASTLGLMLLAKHGTYGAGRLSVSAAVRNMLSPTFLLLAAPAFVSLLWMRTGWERAGACYLIPALSLLGFFIVFLPWGIAAYLQTVILPFVGASIVQVIWGSPYSTQVKSYAFYILVFMALVVTSYRSTINFVRLHDLGEILSWVENSHLPEELPVYANCYEGSYAMERYIRKESGRPITVTEWATVKKPGKNFLFLGDSALCPMIGKIDDCTVEELKRGSFGGSFRVDKWRCL